MDSYYEFRGYALDSRERTLFRGPTQIRLRRRSFDLLCVLVASAGRLVERATFFEKVWGGVAVSEGVLRVSVRELRASLNDDAKRPSFIETVARSGYRFIAPVTKRTSGAARSPSGIAPAPLVRFVTGAM